MPSPNSHPVPLAQDYTVIYHNPNPEEYVEGSGLLRLEDGTLLAVVPVVPGRKWSQERRVEDSRAHILRSRDRGRTWQEIARLPRLYSAVPWAHGGAVYLFANKGGTKFRNDDLLLLKSEDGGVTWSDPVTLFKGHFWNCHTGMVIRDNHLYWAIDDLSFGMDKRGPCVVAGDLSKDLLDPAAWRISNPVPFPGLPPELLNLRLGGAGGQYLEPNVIEVNGRLRVLATVKPSWQRTTGLAAVFDVEDDGEKLRLEFTQFHPMPGGQLKFCVIWDEVSRMFWAAVNLPVDGQENFNWYRKSREEGRFHGSGGNDRRFLMLLYGLDGLNWFQAGCIARAGGILQSFMYPRPVIDGDDLILISRTSIDALEQHDADYATFHRVRDFRSRAMNLYPDSP